VRYLEAFADLPVGQSRQHHPRDLLFSGREPLEPPRLRSFGPGPDPGGPQFGVGAVPPGAGADGIEDVAGGPQVPPRLRGLTVAAQPAAVFEPEPGVVERPLPQVAGQGPLE